MDIWKNRRDNDRDEGKTLTIVYLLLKMWSRDGKLKGTGFMQFVTVFTRNVTAVR